MRYTPFREARERQTEHLAACLPRLREAVAELAAGGALAGPGPVMAGIGASLAAAAAPVWELRSHGIEAYRVGAGDDPVPLAATDRPVIAVSQSGRSPETVALLASAPERRRIAVVNEAPSPLTGVATFVVGLGGLPDSYASTLGYTATAMALGLVADVLGTHRTHPGWEDVPGEVGAVEGVMARSADALAAAFRGAASVDVVAHGASLGSAEEGALLLREVVRLPATAMSTRQYLHGAMESAGGGVHLLFGGDRELAVAAMLADAGHRCVVVTPDGRALPRGVVGIPIPDRLPGQRALLEAAVLQSLVQTLAEDRGLDIEDFVFHHTDTKIGVPE